MDSNDLSLTARELNESLVENLPLSVFQKDREFRLLFGNRRFCNALGRSLQRCYSCRCP